MKVMSGRSAWGRRSLSTGSVESDSERRRSILSCTEDVHMPDTLAEDEESPTMPATSALKSFLSMSRVKQLTFISFSLTNLGVGCFFSVLGPFFPTEVYNSMCPVKSHGFIRKSLINV